MIIINSSLSKKAILFLFLFFLPITGFFFLILSLAGCQRPDTSVKREKEISGRISSPQPSLSMEERETQEKEHTPPLPQEGEWLQFLGDSYHRSASWSSPVKNESFFEISLGAPIMGSPVIYENRVYIGTMRGHLYCIDLNNTPKVLWRFQAGHKIVSSPAVYWGGNDKSGRNKGKDGRIYVGSQDKYLYCVNLQGEEKWKYQAGGPISSSITVDSYGGIYFTAFDGYLHHLTGEGEFKWKFPVEHEALEFISTPAVDQEGNIYAGSDKGYLYSLDSSGKLRWKFAAKDNITASPMLDGRGNVYISSGDGYLYSLNSQGGLNWKFNADTPLEASPVLSHNDLIYIGGRNSFFYGINLRGEVQWRLNTQGAVNAAASSDKEGNAYFGTEEGILYCVSEKGRVLWNKQLRGSIISTPALGEGRLIIGCEEGWIYIWGRE